MRTTLSILLSAFMSIMVIGQESNTSDKINHEGSVQDLIQAQLIVVNTQLVESFNNYQPNARYVSFNDIYRELRGRQRMEFVRQYLISDLENETLEDIKLRAMDQSEIYEEENVELTEEDIAWFKEVKKEISLKLNSKSLASTN